MSEPWKSKESTNVMSVHIIRAFVNTNRTRSGVYAEMRESEIEMPQENLNSLTHI